MLRFSSFIAVAAGILLQDAIAGAFPNLPAQVVATYPSATNLESCGTCHVSFDGSNTATNAYGAAYAAASFSFAAIEGDDSDGDGTSNIDEINSGAGFFPGWTCENYTSAESAPVDLADFVDPVDPGCDGGTTTTTITRTTTVTVTSTSTTTSTVPSGAGRVQPLTTTRLYETQGDLLQMQSLLMQARRHTNDWRFAHVGELNFNFFMVTCHLNPQEFIRLWHDDLGALVGFAILGEDPSFDCQVLPDTNGLGSRLRH